MSNSSLATYKWTGSKTNCNVRDHKIDRITIHMMAGNGSLYTCFSWLSRPGNQGSVNYGIDSNGTIGVMIDEDKRAWTSSSRSNDMRAVTIEVANDSGAPSWHVSDKALNSVINLCADICKRNGIAKLEYTGDTTCKTGNMTLHKWFAATSCPGPYLEGKMKYIANEVNKNLGVVPAPTPSPNPPQKKTNEEIAKEVIQGKWGAGEDRKKKLTAAGYDYAAVQKIVDQMMAGTYNPNLAKKPNLEVAKEVIQGKWGAGQDRVNRLTKAGYNAKAVQKIVDELMAAAKKPKTPKKSNEQVAKEVIQGKWGVDPARSKALKAAGYDPKVIQSLVNQMLK